MDNIDEHLRDLSEIRSMMERNSKFLSLSGLSGISAGLFGLAGTVAAWVYLDYSLDAYVSRSFAGRDNFIWFFLLVASTVLVGAIGSALFFSTRMAKKRSLPMWNKAAQQTLVNLAIPLLVGGAFCLIQLWHGYYLWVSSTTLLFYGMALLNASKNTLPEIKYLGYCELALGLLCAVWAGRGLLFWGVGFGIMHIVYGLVMYFKYEK